MSHKAGKWKSEKSSDTSGTDIFWGIVFFLIIIVAIQGN